MRYLDFFLIEVSHPYYSKNPPGVALIPQEKTLNFLRKQHFLLKKTYSGVKVLIPLNEKGVFPIIDKNDVLTFDVFPTSKIFREVTDISSLADDEIFLFSGNSEDTAVQELSRTNTKTNGGDVLCGFPVIARIEIQLSKVDKDSIGEAPTFRASFLNKSIQWKYYFLANPDDLGFAVEDRNHNLLFNQLALEEETSDQIATSLKSIFTDAKLAVFESSTAIELREQPLKNIQLLQSANILIKHLPNPRVNDNGIQIIQIR